MKLAEESGNKLTQNVNEDGELVGVDGTNTSEKKSSKRTSVLC